MTDEERADDYEMDCIADVYKDDVCAIPYAYSAQKIVKAYLDGLAEGRKEVTYMTAKEYDKTLDKCKECYNKDLEKTVEELQLNLRSGNDLVEELTMQIERMKNCQNCKHNRNEELIPCVNCNLNKMRWELAE